MLSDPPASAKFREISALNMTQLFVESVRKVSLL